MREEDPGFSERRRNDLAGFLRARRRQLTPESAGISTSRNRRTPGLRREEVAFLADIGAKWYARLEMADDVRPSIETLSGIAKALQLSSVDTDYLFELAGLFPTKSRREPEFDVPEHASALLETLVDVPAVLSDPFLTPLRWNSLADAVFQWSTFASAIERNIMVRAFCGDGAIQNYTGSDFERAARNAVGMFRRYYVAGEPSAFACELYERLRTSPLFDQFWNEHTVSDALNDGQPIVRQHPTAGVITFSPLDLYFYRRNDVVLKIYLPANDDTARKLEELRGRGTASF